MAHDSDLLALATLQFQSKIQKLTLREIAEDLKNLKH